LGRDWKNGWKIHYHHEYKQQGGAGGQELPVLLLSGFGVGGFHWQRSFFSKILLMVEGSFEFMLPKRCQECSPNLRIMITSSRACVNSVLLVPGTFLA
jgi:hypothetical protein